MPPGEQAVKLRQQKRPAKQAGLFVLRQDRKALALAVSDHWPFTPASSKGGRSPPREAHRAQA